MENIHTEEETETLKAKLLQKFSLGTINPIIKNFVILKYLSRTSDFWYFCCAFALF